MTLESLTAISPLDGRYYSKMKGLPERMSEYALIRYRTLVEVKWFLFLSERDDIPQLPRFNKSARTTLEQLTRDFSVDAARKVKAIEEITNHDVKAVEYFVKQFLSEHEVFKPYREFVHIGCTSEDINNLAHALMLKESRSEVLLPAVGRVISDIAEKAETFVALPMLSRTHGQPASPTTLGKELANFACRMDRQRDQMSQCDLLGKFNGAVGNYNAQLAAFPDIDWLQLSKEFVESLGLTFNPMTTQIEPHDYMAEYFHALMRFNQVLLDFVRDVWGYISIGYFSQRKVAGETGSSTMPHKVNPIDFENCEGNIGLANALLSHLADKLVVSRWQRDLSDSTVLRNLGSALGYSLLAYESVLKGLGKLEVNAECMRQDLDSNWEVLAEPVQTVMRKYALPEPYEQLKALTRGKQMDAEVFRHLLSELDLPDEVRKQLANLKPSNYVGLAEKLARESLSNLNNREKKPNSRN